MQDNESKKRLWHFRPAAEGKFHTPDGDGVPEQFWNCADVSIGGAPAPDLTPTAEPPVELPPLPELPTSPPTTEPTPASTECVSHEELVAINAASTYWPACDPSQASKGTASGYVFGEHCSAAWSSELNAMLSELGLCGHENCEVRQKFPP